jgi:hypothetical protein
MEQAKAALDADPSRDNRNIFTVASRELDKLWQSSDGPKNEKFVMLQDKLKELNNSWRNIYVAARTNDPAAQKLWDETVKASEIMDEAKKKITKKDNK